MDELLADLPVGISPVHRSAVDVVLKELPVVALSHGALWTCPPDEPCEAHAQTRGRGSTEEKAAQISDVLATVAPQALALQRKGAPVVLAVSAAAEPIWEESLADALRSSSFEPWLLRRVNGKLVRIIASAETLADSFRRGADSSLCGGTTTVERRPNRPELTQDPPKSGLTREEIEQQLRTVKGKIQSCFVASLSSQNRNGKIVYSFLIGPDGRVKAGCVRDDTLGSSTVNHCVARSVGGLTFPRPRFGADVLVNYPYLFTVDE